MFSCSFFVITSHWEAYCLIEKLFFKLNYLKTDTDSLFFDPSIFIFSSIVLFERVC